MYHFSRLVRSYEAILTNLKNQKFLNASQTWICVEKTESGNSTLSYCIRELRVNTNCNEQNSTKFPPHQCIVDRNEC